MATTISGDTDSETPLVCSLTEKELSERSVDIRALFAERRESVEVSDGYSLRFAGDSETILRLVATIAAERACCLFFTFGLTFMPNLGPVWLEIRGPEGVKEMVRGILAPA